MSIMSKTLSDAFNLEQKTELAEQIKFIQANDKKIKSNKDLQRFILESSKNNIDWRELSIAQFKDKFSLFSLPEDKKQQQDLIQIIIEKAKALGYGASPDPRYEGKDPELYKLLQQVFQIPEADPENRKRRVLAVSVADFANAFEKETDKKFNTDWFRNFINNKGSLPHRFTQSVRDALYDFAQKCLDGKVELRPNNHLGNATPTPT